jgi:hypothetical protein
MAPRGPRGEQCVSPQEPDDEHAMSAPAEPPEPPQPSEPLQPPGLAQAPGPAGQPEPVRSAAPRGERAERVAIVAIHGVADQKLGDTARAIASLMVNAGAPQARYSRGDCDSYIVAVPPLLSMVESGSHAQGAARKRVAQRDPPPVAKDAKDAKDATGAANAPAQSLRKALRQSVRSDFLRDNWSTTHAPHAPHAAHAAPGGGTAAAKSAPGAPAATAGATATATAAPGKLLSAPARLMTADPGIAFSDYLLFKWQGAGHEAYEATRIRMVRHQAVPGTPGITTQHVDVHEMYWADLSRLSGVLPRIVTELFTMVFRLSQLGRDAVDRAGLYAARHKSARAYAWGGLAKLQMALDWAFSGVLANLFLQLLLAGLVVAGLGLAAPHAGALHIVLALLLPALAAWWYCYLHVVRPLRRSAAVVLAVAAAVLLCLVPAPWTHWLIGLSWLALLGVVFNYGLRVADARFPAMRAAGLVFLGAMAATLLVHVGMASAASNGAGALADWVRAGLRTVEYLLLGIVVWWLLAGVLLIAWAFFGQWAARDGPAARASVATGRLGLFVSIASFVALAMAIWALVTTFVEFGAAGVDYEPLVFKSGLMCFVDGASFLHLRYQRSTETFALAAGLTLALAAYLVVVLVPSVLAEVKNTVGTPRTLGRWLTGGYRRLDGFVTGLTMASVLMACGVGVLLALARLGVEPDGWVGAAARAVGELSALVLKPLVLSAATAAAALSAFGGVLSRYVPWLRLPLDVALDVDNHFREFPRRAIPRARIFSRYVALLESIAAQGYDRVVIVAHSQGTVISAELLRYLQHRARWLGRTCPDDRVVKLWSQLEGKVDLFTAGCPLRQLYAARFPHLYEWVPTAQATDVGVVRWVNAYATGDYVGRWLWSDPPRYEPSPASTAATAAMAMATSEHDVCLGSGAHTHYFDQEQVLVAGWIDALVR